MMQIQKLRLTYFRNFKTKLLEFSPDVTVIIGPNASGKTNILESLFVLATGKSFRARIEEEMINYSREIARIKGLIKRDNQKSRLEVVLTRGKLTIGTSPERVEKVARKRLLLNGVGKRLIDFSGNFKVVLFGPWDLHLVTESPSLRRRFLDTVLSQVDREYRRASLSYEKGLRQRNRLLYQIREESWAISGHARLLFWDRLLIKNGDYISAKRGELISFINARSDFNRQDFSLEYDKSAISEARLAQYAQEEIAAATTLVGPHRDDFCFRLRKNKHARDLSKYGSRGEQRMAVLWLKLAELAYIEEQAEDLSAQAGKPTLLLDDIFSELDHEHRKIVMQASVKQQTIITTADPHFIEGLKKVEKIRLEG